MQRAVSLRRGALVASAIVVTTGLGWCGVGAAVAAEPSSAAPTPSATTPAVNPDVDAATVHRADATFAPGGVGLDGDGLEADPVVGLHLVADPYDWPDGTTFTYQWFRSASASDPGEPIAGATDASYALTATDRAHFVSVVLTGSDGSGSADARSRALLVHQAPTFSEPAVQQETAGVAFTFHAPAADGDGAIAYTLADPGTLPDGVTFDDGTFTGRLTTAGAWDVSVVATSEYGTAREQLLLEVGLGTITASGVAVTPSGTPSDGTHWFLSDGRHGAAVRWARDQAYELAPIVADEYGNTAGSFDVADTRITSTNPTDVFGEDGLEVKFPTVTFRQGGHRVITVTHAGYTTTFAVDLPADPAVGPTPVGDPTRTTPVATRPAPTTSVAGSTVASPRTSALAYTGSDPAAGLPWAFGAVAAGLGTALLGRRRARR